MQDFIYILQWWLVLIIIGLIFLPFTISIFDDFLDFGYAFSKTLAIAILSYSLFFLSTIKLLPFDFISILILLVVFITANYFLLKNTIKKIKSSWKIFVFEEVVFLLCLSIWSFVRAHEPSINGLEKFMDFGFLNSILRTNYLPATDMWFPPLPINYYYFGHFATALLTKLSFIPSYVTYNLMVATIFAFTFTLCFSLIINFIGKKITRKVVVGGLLGGILVSVSGNLHTFYSLFQPYQTDNPVPFWVLNFSPSSFPNAYWYPNATRFIFNTIHEFPIYSFVVSDLHGHVIDIIFVLLGIGLIYKLFIAKKIDKLFLIFISFIIALMYMTNAWDGLIYILLTSVVLVSKNFSLLTYRKQKLGKIFPPFILLKSFGNKSLFLFENLKYFLILIISFILFTFPFSIHFKPFASGIGILCAPDFLIKLERLGPFLFEADHCQTSPWWQLLILYGFFYFFVISFLIFVYKRLNKITKQDIFILILILVSSILIIVPEFIYVKDIYPAHYRANTMFKLVYQAFIMLSIVSTYTIIRVLKDSKNKLFLFPSVILLFIVLSYPYFAVNSYYGDLKTYKGLDGIAYLKDRYPEDYDAINWINQYIKGQPIIVEAVGDSYTDYARISANTGLPTVVGWPVHEWLWRGSYDFPSPRIDDVKTIYETTNTQIGGSLLEKYNAEYIYVGGLEREKYPNLEESKFRILGKIVFEENNTRIYKVN